MKKMIKKFWGVGLIVVLLSSLFVAAAPVSAADPLNWEMKLDAPAAFPFAVLAPNTDIVSFDVNGSMMYAVTGAAPGAFAQALMQSNSGGAMWTDISTRISGLVANADLVAMAPDDPNVLVVGCAATPALAISVNGGATFTSMGLIQSQNGTAPATVIRGIAVSPIVTGGVRYVVAYGTDGTNGGIYFYNYGSGVGFWFNALIDGNVAYNKFPVLDDVSDNVVAFAFSPNFASDYMATALITDGSDNLKYHVLSFSGYDWDATVAAGYPTTVYTGVGALVVNKASIGLIPDYDGSDESLRIAFFGAAMTDGGSEIGGVWRAIDSAPPAKVYGSATIGSGTAISSVATDGTNLAAGAYTSNNVFRSADPLATTPTFLGARNYKKIGVDDAGADKVLVKFDGATLYGGKIGAGSAISKSTDYGNVWNDYTMMDSAITTPDDIWFSATGDPWYVSAHDAATTSIFRISAFAVTRVLCVPNGATDAIGLNLRGTAADGNVIYGFDKAALMNIFYSADGGLTKWNKRSNTPATIADLAVESGSVIYIASGINVYKSINSGFTWGTPVNCKLALGNVYSMLSIGEGKLIVGGTAGGVNWSTDGGATWFASIGVIAGGNMLVAASSLDAGNYVFAANKASTAVYRCQIGPSNPAGEWKTMNAPAANHGEITHGFVLTNGVLYAVSANGTDTYLNRTLAPSIPGTHSSIFWGTQYEEAGVSMDVGINSLRTSSGAPGDIMLYGFSSVGPLVQYYQDTLALNGPTLAGPADKDKIEIVSQLTGAAQAVNFTWKRLSKATSYTLFIALDSSFFEMVGAPIGVASTMDPVSYIAASSLISPVFLPGNTYYWRVSATTPIGSAFSETRSFTVQPTAATVPSIGGPASGATINTLKPAFSWSPVSGTTSYKFQLSEGTAFAAPIYDTETTVAGAQLPLTVTLEDGKTYFWRVKALAPVEGDWSSIANFTVALPVSTTQAPPVVITSQPAPTFTITQPAPTSIVMPTQPPDEVINPAYIWVIIIIGAVLVIAVIVLIVRTRRSV